MTVSMRVMSAGDGYKYLLKTVPVLGDHPQSLISTQGVDKSDIVFALFGSRLGSPTPSAVSGTVEEVERAVESGKSVHPHFSTAALPNDVDTRQLDDLREFRAEISKRGLLASSPPPRSSNKRYGKPSSTTSRSLTLVCQS